MLTTLLDIFGVVLIAAFAWFCWPPLVLLIVGAAALSASRAAERGPAGKGGD